MIGRDDRDEDGEPLAARGLVVRHEPAKGPSRIGLLVLRGESLGVLFVLDEGTVTMGRHESNALRLADRSVSRHHVELALAGDGLRVRDLGSASGCYVNGLRSDDASLQIGDELRVGGALLRVVSVPPSHDVVESD